MKLLLLATLLAGCSPAALTSPPGALFCRVQLAGGGAIIAAVTAAAVTIEAPAAGPLIVVATGAAKQAVDQDCARAAASVPGGVSGVPVPPPMDAASVQSVAIVAPASPVMAK